MADKSKIEWTDATWNIINGCKTISPGCTNCFAQRLAGTRFRNHPTRSGLTIDSKAGPVWNGEVKFIESMLDQPIRWKRPRLIFVCAHGDLFHEGVPDAWIDKIFSVMAGCKDHTFQVLTKRSGRMRAYLSRFKPSPKEDGFITRDGVHNNDSVPGWPIFNPSRWPLPNVWLGVSVEDQARADERIQILLDTPAAVHWLSVEPMLGRIFMPTRTYDELDCIVVGGESGPKARPMHPDWVREIRDQCLERGTHFDFKQWGEFTPWELLPKTRIEPWRRAPDGSERYFVQDLGKPHDQTERVTFLKVGKKAAGRMLDGKTYDGMREIPR